MKIVHTEASCGWGGQELRILSEASGFIARGHDVTLLCPPEAKIYSAARDFGIPAVALPIGRKRPRGLIALYRWLARNPVDVVNTHSSTDSWLTALARQMLVHRPAVVRTRHISAPVPTNASTRWLYRRGCDHIVTTGEILRQTLIRDNGLSAERITSVPTGIDGTRFVPGDKAAVRMALGLAPAARYIGIVATLRSWKGHLYLIEACAKLADRDWRLLIIGDGPMRAVLEAKTAELGLTDRISLVGQCGDPERWLQALDVFCLPSYANEGVPYHEVQAMMSGLPVVTTPVGSITEAVRDGDNGIIVPPQDADALQAAIARLLDDSALAGRLGHKARAEVLQVFGRERMIDRMAAVFAAAVERA